MARRRRHKQESPISILLGAHWGISAGLMLGSLILFQGILPAALSRNPFASMMLSGIAPLGWLMTGLFGLTAAISFVRAIARRHSESHALPPENTVDKSNAWQPLPWAERSSALTGLDETAPSKPTTCSLALLRSIDWRRFEEVVAAYFRAKCLRTETQTHGADGGIDVRLYPNNGEKPLALVQCKAWKNKPVGIAPVRELLGVMTHEGVARGFFVTTGEFSSEALAFAESHRITLVPGNRFVEMVKLQPADVQAELLAIATEGDYLTPTCASCGIKMVNHGKFWGCSNFPRCKMKIQIAA